MTQLIANSVAVITEPVIARRLVLTGGVQGLGVRPTIYRLATKLHLSGTVRNSSRGVEIEIEGAGNAVRHFEADLLCSLPRPALVVQLEAESIAPTGRQDFTIIKESPAGALDARVPTDRCVCSECLREISEPGDRRYNYPLTSCTHCGPRYTVIRAMPFERHSTTMESFPLCADCWHEYESPGDRRFHAQTTACQKCGPHISLSTRGGSEDNSLNQALNKTLQELKQGKIVALKGLGGYQLFVDATNKAAVERLRERKGRRAKPLAVMIASDDAAKRLAHLDSAELAALNDPAGPIVLARAHSKSGLAPNIHSHLDTVGVIRPTTPLHAKLANTYGRPLVCTSGNREGNPLEFQNGPAETHLADVADVWLHHDREIVRPIDDSVVRIITGRSVTMRLGRGLAPLTLELPAVPPMIALGGFLKSAVAWSNGTQCVLGPHIGDLESLPARERYLAHLKDMLRLYRFRPELLVHDLHPDYFSARWAMRQKVPRLAVQHHHAHVAAGMLEHNWLDRRVLGVAWDGTGYGTDGTIWGGEFLVCEGSEFERIARLRPFTLPGGEAAIREPWRIAVSVCSQLEEPHELTTHADWQLDANEIAQVRQIMRRPKLSPITSSAGRLIDAAAALILGISQSEFEGQAAMRLEAAADQGARGWYHFPVADEDLCELDWRPLFAGLLEDQRRGIEPSALAMKFHRSLAHGIMSVCGRWSELPAVFSGGVFQNKLLTELIAEMGGSTSQPLGFPGKIPPNDGGLAAGQLAIAAAKVRR